MGVPSITELQSINGCNRKRGISLLALPTESLSYTTVLGAPP